MKSRLATAIFFFIALGLFLLSAPLWASGDCKGNQPCNNTNTDVDVANEIIGGDISIAGDKSESLGLGFGRSSFDVDINQCMGSTSWDTIVGGKQKLVVNWVCLAEFYLKTNQPDLAAVAICNTEMVKEFASEAECEEAHDFFVEVAEAIPNTEHFDEEEELHIEQQMLYAEMKSQIETLERQVQNVPVRVVEKPLLTDEQKRKLKEVIEE